jgi:hypothetical protein
MNRLTRILAAALAFSALTAIPLTAGATVKKEGDWPGHDKKVTFEFDGKPSEGLKELASEAGWSLVVSKGIQVGESDVHIAVEDQPADAVLEALFAEGNVVAKRSGTLVTIRPAGAADATAQQPPPVPTPPEPQAAPSVPSPPPVPTIRGEDRNVMGASLTIGKSEIVHTVTVTGGSAKIEGTVTGDLIVTGGSATVEEGARVVGNVTVFGGSIRVESGGRVDGDVGVVGGALKREDGAIIGGNVVDKSAGDHGKIKIKAKDGTVSSSVEKEDGPHGRNRLAEKVHSFGQSMTKMALLFVLGCVFLALATGRMEKLRVEAAARPMRSFALGIATAILATFVFIAVCLTIVGIPFAVLALLAAILATYVAIAAVLTTFGAAVIGHKTQNPYAHLLFGCAAFLIIGAIPYIGGIATFAVTMIAIGTLYATRIGGLMAKKPGPQLV